jgi:transposase
MRNDSSETRQITIGLDLGDRKSYFKIFDKAGELLEEGRIPTTSKALQKQFSSMPRARIALEVGTQSGWVSRALQSLGHEVIVANARKLRLIYENKRKDDRVDAEYLARVARLDVKLLSPIQHRGAQAQADLELVRGRENLLRCRTQLINHVRSAAKLLGKRLPASSTPSFARKVRPEIPLPLEQALVPLLDLIAQLTETIREYDRVIEQWCEQKYPETGLLRQVTGVGPLSALTYVLTLETPHRFGKSREVGPFLGLSPGRKQSGERDPQRRITKQGDRYLRQLLVNCAHYILGPFGIDSDLRRHGEKIAARGGPNAKKRAVVAVARKLGVLLHHLWVSGEVYEPLYNSPLQPVTA